MTVIERFLKYVSFDTQSDENSGVTPSTPKQMVFAQYLKSELEQLAFRKFLWMRMVICLLHGRPIRINRFLPSDLLHTWIPVPI